MLNPTRQYGRYLVGILLALILGYGYGLISYKFNLFPVPVVRYVKEYAQDDGIDRIGYRNTIGKIEIDCGRLPKESMVLLTIGQSNSANHGETRFTPGDNVYNFNFFDGRCYKAYDPLLGATGRDGSVWTRLADLLIKNSHAHSVIIVPVGVNASSILSWKPDGNLYPRIESALSGLRSFGFTPTYVLWHQGEADAMEDMSSPTYANALQSVLNAIRSQGVTAPIHVAITSMCHNSGSDDIRNAQREIVKRNQNVFLGANSDLLDSLTLRYDGCHFSDEGLWQHAALWLDSLSQPKE